MTTVAKSAELLRVCREHDVLACYAFGSRADDGPRILAGDLVERGTSDLDIGVVFAGAFPGHRKLASLQVAMEDLFAPLKVDLVPLERVDPLFQFSAISGHRLATTNTARADRFELQVMRRAAELLPIQRRLEIDTFGLTTR